MRVLLPFGHRPDTVSIHSSQPRLTCRWVVSNDSAAGGFPARQYGQLPALGCHDQRAPALPPMHAESVLSCKFIFRILLRSNLDLLAPITVYRHTVRYARRTPPTQRTQSREGLLLASRTRPLVVYALLEAHHVLPRAVKALSVVVWRQQGITVCRYETFYDDALDAVDELRTTGVASDGLPDTATTTEVTCKREPSSCRRAVATQPAVMQPVGCAQSIMVDPDTDVEVDDMETILMEDIHCASTSTSGSSSSTSGSDEGSDEDAGDAPVDSEPRSPPTRADVLAKETAFADSSVAFQTAKPAVPFRDTVT